MKYIIITILGIAINAILNIFLRATVRDMSLILPKIYLALITIVLLIILIISIIYNYHKYKNKNRILAKALIAFFLLLMILQSCFVADAVVVN